MKLIIQIPCYNEEQTLVQTLKDLPRNIKGIDRIEILIINDGSCDHTIEVAKQWGVNHIIDLKRNKGLAFAFMAGIDAGLRLGADIIVNTDADNQYNGQDIIKLVKPILDGESDIVIGERPIDTIEHFSKTKKLMQRFGSMIVRKAARAEIPDAPSGFRAYSREAAMKINVTNQYTYTLETIIQAGRNKIVQTSVPVRTNPELRPSRLFKSMGKYIQRSGIMILRTYLMYEPLKTFLYIALCPLIIGGILGVRYLYLIAIGQGAGHTQSLILCSILLILGFVNIMIGMLADLIAKNRKLLEDIQYHVRKIDYDNMSMSRFYNNGKNK